MNERNLTTWLPQTKSGFRLTQVGQFFDKNLLLDELNVLRQKLNVKTKQGIDDYRLKTSMVG